MPSAGIAREHTIPDLLNYFTSIDSEDAFRRMCVPDALIFNPDRHYGNFGMLFHTDAMESLGMAPVSDNNRSLFPELDEGQLANPWWYVRKCRPKWGKDFIVTARGLLTPEIQSDLKNPRGFRVRQHPTIPLSQKRLALPEKMMNDRLTALLNE